MVDMKNTYLLSTEFNNEGTKSKHGLLDCVPFILWWDRVGKSIFQGHHLAVGMTSSEQDNMFFELKEWSDTFRPPVFPSTKMDDVIVHTDIKSTVIGISHESI
jgi:hypothetical protein